MGSLAICRKASCLSTLVWEGQRSQTALRFYGLQGFDKQCTNRRFGTLFSRSLRQSPSRKEGDTFQVFVPDAATEVPMPELVGNPFDSAGSAAQGAEAFAMLTPKVKTHND